MNDAEAKRAIEVETLRVSNEANQEIIRQLVNALAAARVEIAQLRAELTKPPQPPAP